MWLKQSFLATLKDFIAGAFTLGSDVGNAVLRRRLRMLRTRSRRLSTAGACAFFSCAAVLAVMPILLDTASWTYRAVSTVVCLIMVASGVAAHEASRIVTLVDALEDLLFYDSAMGPLDIAMAFQNRLQAEIGGEPSWEPLVAILSQAYVTTSAVQTKLLAAKIPIGYLNLGQSAADLWRDALRAAHRSQQLEALLTCILSDTSISAFHAQVRACRASLVP